MKKKSYWRASVSNLSLDFIFSFVECTHKEHIMTDTPQLTLPTVNVTIDVKEAILKILENSNSHYNQASTSGGDAWHGCLRLHANNMCIRALLESIK